MRTLVSESLRVQHLRRESACAAEPLVRTTGEPLEPGGRRRRTGCSFLIDANAYCVKFGTTYPPVDSRTWHRPAIDKHTHSLRTRLTRVELGRIADRAAGLHVLEKNRAHRVSRTKPGRHGKPTSRSHRARNGRRWHR